MDSLLADGAQLMDNGPYGKCPKCGTWIEYPPLCENPKCNISWHAYGVTIARQTGTLPYYDDEVEILDEREV